MTKQSNKVIQPEPEPETTEDDETVVIKKLPASIREYMIKMRSEKDYDLFIFKSSDLHEQYSRQCNQMCVIL